LAENASALHFGPKSSRERWLTERSTADAYRDVRRSSGMRIKIINPNTTESMTAKIRAAAVAAAAPGTEVIACNPRRGPVSIESHYDEAVSAIGVLERSIGEGKGVMAT